MQNQTRSRAGRIAALTAPFALGCLLTAPTLAGDGTTKGPAPLPSTAVTTSVADVDHGWRLHAFSGDAYGAHFGDAVAGAGDVDGDGCDDVIVGAPYQHAATGRAVVYSGRSGRVLLELVSPAAGAARFGSSVAGAGDLDGDGHGDLLVGAHADDPTKIKGAGSAWAFSGHDGSVLFAMHGDDRGDELGRTAVGLDDLDGDGVPDLAVGAPSGNFVRLVSGTDGHELATLRGQADGDRFGVSLARTGDLDGDGIDEFMVGADQSRNAGVGYVRVFNGATREVLHGFQGARAKSNFGGTVAGLGDVDGDGIDDVAVGSGTLDLYRSMAEFTGVKVYSGATGEPLLDLPRPAAFLADAGDIDDDGHGDLLVGQPTDDSAAIGAGSVTVISGADGSVLATLHGALAGERLGIAVAAAGDVDGDGDPDVIIGGDDFGTRSRKRGTATVIDLAALLR